MPEADSYSFPHKELLAILIKASGVKDGEWMLAANFGFAAGNFGPDETGVNPGAIVVLDHLSITRARPDSPKSLVMSAADAKASPTASAPPSEQSQRVAPKKAKKP